MKKYLGSALKLLLSISFGVFLIWLVVKDLTETDKQEIFAAFENANYAWILIAVSCGVLSHISRAFRWKMLLVPTGHNPRTLNVFLSIMAMYIGNLAFPRLGEALRCGILNRYEKIPLEKSVGTMITERAVDLISLAMVGVIVLLFEYDLLLELLLPLFSEKAQACLLNWTFYLALLVLGVVLALIFAYLLRAEKLPYSTKIKKLLLNLWHGITSIKDLKKPWIFIGHSVFIWLMYFCMIYLSVFALPETSSLSPLAGISCLFFGSFAMILVQGGLGAYPLVIQKLLIPYGISSTMGFAFGWLVWSTQTLLVLVGGLLSLVELPIVNNDNPKSQNGLSANSSEQDN